MGVRGGGSNTVKCQGYESNMRRVGRQKRQDGRSGSRMGEAEAKWGREERHRRNKEGRGGK